MVKSDDRRSPWSSQWITPRRSQRRKRSATRFAIAGCWVLRLTSMQTDDIARRCLLRPCKANQQPTGVRSSSMPLALPFSAQFTNDRARLEKAVARLTPDVASQLADLSYAAAQNGGSEHVRQYTGAAYTADETEFNTFDTNQKLLAVQGLVDVSARFTEEKR